MVLKGQQKMLEEVERSQLSKQIIIEDSRKTTLNTYSKS